MEVMAPSRRARASDSCEPPVVTERGESIHSHQAKIQTSLTASARTRSTPIPKNGEDSSLPPTESGGGRCLNSLLDRCFGVKRSGQHFARGRRNPPTEGAETHLGRVGDVQLVGKLGGAKVRIKRPKSDPTPAFRRLGVVIKKLPEPSIALRLRPGWEAGLTATNVTATRPGAYMNSSFTGAN